MYRNPWFREVENFLPEMEHNLQKLYACNEGQIRLSDFTFTFHFHALEKEMATNSSVLAWRIPGTGEPGGLLSTWSHRVGHDWSDLAAAAVSGIQQSDLLYICVYMCVCGGTTGQRDGWELADFCSRLISSFYSNEKYELASTYANIILSCFYSCDTCIANGKMPSLG